MRIEGLSKALWVFFLCVFSWPLIGAADRASAILGIPSVFLYLFAGWALLIVILACVSRRVED